MSQKFNLTPKRIDDFPHPESGKAFLWDQKTPGLGVLASPTRKNFTYEGKYNKKSLRITIGATVKYTVEEARERATEFQHLIDQGIDPREEKKRRHVEEEAAREESKRQDVIVSKVWAVYIEERKNCWSDRHYLDHIRLTHEGGKKKKRGVGKTVPGVLHSIMELPLSSITPETVEDWLKKESHRKTQSRLGFEALRAFIAWCEDKKQYRGIASPDACSAKIKKKGQLHKKKAKDDCLQKEQLRAWFQAVGDYHNRIISAYLQTVLLTGARREEVLSLKWSDVDFKWRSLTIKDKVEGERVIPLTPYIGSLLSSLPRRNSWAFSSPTAESGRLQEPRIPHNKCLAVAGIEGLTIHGLRRSFGTLAEWTEMPVGIVYQIQGHKPSATAEKHYRKRPLDLLRKWHVKLEAWILEQAGIEQPTEEARPLKVLKQSNS